MSATSKPKRASAKTAGREGGRLMVEVVEKDDPDYQIYLQALASDRGLRTAMAKGRRKIR